MRGSSAQVVIRSNGLNVSNVIVDGEDIFGDGVNGAARLEGLSEPGSICASDRVQEDAQGRIDIAFGNTGEQLYEQLSMTVHANPPLSE